MKKHLFLILLLFAMPVLLHSVTEEGITITKLSMEPIPFNERRDPFGDSPYNAFDGDLKSAALYSDFTMEFSKPVAIDQIKVVNGNAADKNLFKKQNRERDIEITLYTTTLKIDKVKVEKKKKPAPKKKEEKKLPPADKDLNEKTAPEKIEKAKPDSDKDKKKEEIKKTDTPEKVVKSDNSEIYNEYEPDDVKFYLAAAETVIETPDKTKVIPVEKKPVIKKKTETKKTDNKKASPVKSSSVKKEVKKNSPAEKSKKKTETKTVKTPVKKNTSAKNIIEIRDSKKDKMIKSETAKSDAVKIRIAEEAAKKNIAKDESETTVIQKELAGTDNSINIEPDKPVEKIPLPDKKEIQKDVKKDVKKVKKQIPGKTTDKTVGKDPAKTDAIKKRSENKSGKKVEGKTGASKKTETAKASEIKKTVKEEADKKTSEKTADIKITEKKSESKKEVIKEVVKKEKVIETKKEPKKDIKKEISKEEKKIIPAKVVEEKVIVKKMTGVVRIENDKDGRVFVYTTLKDSMDYQSIDLKGEYTITKIEFRTRDDEYYAGTESDRSGMTEISFLNNGKRIPIQGIETSKKIYAERYNNNLKESLSGETFVMLDNNETALRVTFRKDGKLEFYDRFKCAKKSDPDCTSISMPDAWRVADGKLQMRFHTLWRVWKYELDSQSDMLSENSESNPPRWMKIYYKSENGFTDKYLDLVISNNGIRED